MSQQGLGLSALIGVLTKMTRWTPPPLRNAQTEARITSIPLPSLTVIHSCLLTKAGRSKKLENSFAVIGSSHRLQVITERSGSISRSQTQSSCPQTSWRDVWNQLLSTRLHILKLKHIKWSFKFTQSFSATKDRVYLSYRDPGFCDLWFLGLFCHNVLASVASLWD